MCCFVFWPWCRKKTKKSQIRVYPEGFPINEFHGLFTSSLMEEIQI